MDKIIKNILSRIEHEGYEAYIVGGYVRDKLLNRSTFDIDICTNALPKDLMKIFSKDTYSNEYGGFKMKIKQYSIDITTYRKEKVYNNRKPVEIEYISNLIEDIKRRDFTINSLCMDKKENITDILNGEIDLNNRLIKSIGDADKKFKEDPLRMLRAIRFASVLDFKIEDNTYNAIINNYELVDTLSSERIKEEITKILSTGNYEKGLNLLKETKIADIIGLSYSNIIYTSDILGMLSQVNIKRMKYSKTEENIINDIRTICKQNRINNHTLFKYGLYTSSVAGDILKIDRQEINNIYKNLPIKSMTDIEIDGKEVMNLLSLEPSKIISDIINDVKVQILDGKLKNRKHDIKNYIVKGWSNEQR